MKKMSQNNTIRKSYKKFIRLQKARIRRQFFDFKKQEELITELYKKFILEPKADNVTEVAKVVKQEKPVAKSEIKKDKKVEKSKKK